MEKIKIKLKTRKFEAIHLKTLFELSIGLMFRNKGHALLEFPFEGKPGIWMLFMKYSLDLAFLDKNFKAVDIIENVSPLSLNPTTWKTYYPKKPCKYVLELDSRGKIKVEIWDKINIIS